MIQIIEKIIRISCASIIGFSVLFMLYVAFYAPRHAHPIPATMVVRQGFLLAQECHHSDKRLEDIQVNVVPGDGFDVFFNSDRLVGLAFFNRIYVSEKDVNDPWTWAHEFMHSFGVIGHPDKYFKHCNF